MAKKTGTRSKTARSGTKKKASLKAAVAKDPALPADGDEASEEQSVPEARGGARGKSLVIVESPAKAKTINKYLGSGFIVKASVGHVRDLPEKAKKGDKSPVPGVDLKHSFRPTYEVLPGKAKTVSELKRAARSAKDVWFATDLDREGEAIAWHLAHELGIKPADAKRVVFNAITKTEIERAFDHPKSIDEAKVNAQQARRVLDRIVGYQVSPLLWKKVARGLSAGRVQSVAVRVVVEREREIRAFLPEERWEITGRFALAERQAFDLAREWPRLLAQRDEKGAGPTVKAQNAWLAERNAVSADLVEIAGEKFDLADPTRAAGPAMAQRAREIAALAGLRDVRVEERPSEKGKGPAAVVRVIRGEADPATAWRVVSIETRRTTVRAAAPFITSTLQQAASSRLGFGAQRTMRTAQSLYEGVEIPGEGSVGLITYMRTDSTHLSAEAIGMARAHIGKAYGPRYLPEKPNFFSSSNKAAQEAHEAIRPTNVALTPERVRAALKPDQFRLYQLIWQRFVACQMTPAEWDATTALIRGGADPRRELTFRSTGRTLAFDGHYRVSGVPTAADEQTLPSLSEGKPLHAFAVEPQQKFTSPPARYSEASLIKALEAEGIGRPSTYASIVQVIQDRKYVELLERRFFATDLGEVVTDKLVEAFPDIMDVGYTREMEKQLDRIEDEHTDWVEVLRRFYGPFERALERAHEELTHAKAETQPAPPEYRCGKCGSDLVYRFGRNGRFLSCSTYPACDYASPVDREGKPQPVETADVLCPNCGRGMIKRVGRFGPFFGCSGYPECATILKADKKGRPLAPTVPPLPAGIPCPKCQSDLLLRGGARGPWLSCSRYPKCRGRGKWAELPEPTRAALEQALAAHEAAHPIVVIRDTKGRPLTDARGKAIEREEPALELAPDPSPDPGAGEVDAAA